MFMMKYYLNNFFRLKGQISNYQSVLRELTKFILCEVSNLISFIWPTKICFNSYIRSSFNVLVNLVIKDLK